MSVFPKHNHNFMLSNNPSMKLNHQETILTQEKITCVCEYPLYIIVLIISTKKLSHKPRFKVGNEHSQYF